MPIKEVRAVPYQEMVNFSKGQPVHIQGEPPDPSCNEVWVISVIDKELSPIFLTESERVLPLSFADIDPQNPAFVPPTDSEFMKPEQAVQVVDFLERAHSSPKNVLLMVNCRHGMCRSGAIVDFAANVYGLGFWETRRKNPQMVPNYWVRYLLLNEFFKRKFSDTGSKDNNPQADTESRT
jgi:hypothetical protein